MDATAAADPVLPTLIAAIIAAIAAVVAAGIVAWAALRAQSYKQLLRDVHDVVCEVLEKQLKASERGPVIANYVEERMRQIFREVLGEHPDRRRWYDR